jgi:hypothetical protein
MPKYTINAEPLEKPIVISLLEESDGAIVVRATRGGLRAELLRISTDGTIHRIIGQASQLNALGFTTQHNDGESVVIAVADLPFLTVRATQKGKTQ